MVMAFLQLRILYNACISYNTGKNALPDSYIHMIPEGGCIASYISGKALVPVHVL